MTTDDLVYGNLCGLLDAYRAMFRRWQEAAPGPPKVLAWNELRRAWLRLDIFDEYLPRPTLDTVPPAG